MFVHAETESVVSRVGRANMWCLMEPNYPSSILSQEKVSTSINSCLFVDDDRKIIFKLARKHCF